MPRLPRILSALCLMPCLALAGCAGDDDPQQQAPGGADAGDGGGGDGGDAGPNTLTPLFEDSRVPVTDTHIIPGLQGPVDIVRDRFGTVHIFARTVEDAFIAQGWMMAVDRHGQMELLRRVPAGRLSELFGMLDPSLVDDDITMINIGLYRTAELIYSQMEEGHVAKRAVDSFAKGVSAWNAALQAGEVTKSDGFSLFEPKHFTPWTPVDSIAMGRVQSWNLSYDVDTDISITERWKDIVAAFNAQSTDPDIRKRAGYLKEMIRFDPIDPKTPIVGYPDETAARWFGPLAPALEATATDVMVAGPTRLRPARVTASHATLAATRTFRRAVDRIKNRFGFDEHAGSNNWAVHGSLTATGNPMLASDPHLGLVSPMIFWPCHIVVDDPNRPEDNLEVAGLAFAGIPGVILGTGRHVAWGATTTSYDVADAWTETVSADGQGVVFKGQTVPFEKVPIKLAVGNTLDPDMTPEERTFDVLIVPHHGPVIPNIVDGRVVPPGPGDQVISVRWTGHAPTTEFEAIYGMASAKNVDEARQSLTKFGVGGQNWMLADTSGNIAWTSHVNLPHRDARARTFNPADYSGILPGLVLDGSNGEHEWTGGFLDERYVPKARNPVVGYIATANADNIGTTLDNNPVNDALPNGDLFYLGYEFDPGFRVGRIYRRLEAATTGESKMTLEEMASIQGDVRIEIASYITDELIAVLQRAEAENANAGTHPDVAAVVADARYAAANVPDIITTLEAWRDQADYHGLSGVNPTDGSLVADAVEANASKATLVWSAWLIRAMSRIFEDEAQVVGRQNIGGDFTLKAFIRLVRDNPTTLPTYDSATGQSALWDDLTTRNRTETRDEVLGLALLDAIDDAVALLGSDRNLWRWGNVHTVTFRPLNPFWPLTIPPDTDPLFPAGFPRHGGQDVVDASNHDIMESPAFVDQATGERRNNPSFSYTGGPVQRFVAEMTPDGPRIRNALPGGAVGNSLSNHYRDEAEYWRKNENHAWPLSIDEVASEYQAGDEHIRLTP